MDEWFDRQLRILERDTHDYHVAEDALQLAITSLWDRLRRGHAIEFTRDSATLDGRDWTGLVLTEARHRALRILGERTRRPTAGDLTADVPSRADGLDCSLVTDCLSLIAPCLQPGCCSEPHRTAFLLALGDRFRNVAGHCDLSALPVPTPDEKAEWERREHLHGSDRQYGRRAFYDCLTKRGLSEQWFSEWLS